MTRLFSRGTFSIVLFFALAFASTQQARSQVSAVTLDNGLRVITVESHEVPIVAVDAWVRAGTRRESPDQPGVAHFLEHLLFKGTPSHPDEESVDGAIEDLGGTLDAATSYDWAHFYTEVPASGYPQAIALLGDILQHASLKASSIEEERPIILDEVSREEDDPLANLADTARSLIYNPGNAYARPITGSLDQVRAVNRDQIVSFYNTFYVPNNVTIVVSGDVTPADVQKAVYDQMGTWRKSPNLPEDGDSQRSTYRAPDPDQSPVHKSLSEKDADESYMVYAFTAPSVKDQPDAWIMDVLLTLLGQGGNNRLTADLKNKDHYVDGISADYLTQKDPGILTISASLPTSNVDETESAILDEVTQLRSVPVSDKELLAAKNALQANYLFDVDTDSGHADSLGFYDSIDNYEYDVDYLKHISEVTAPDIQQVAQKYLDPDAYTVVLQVPSPDVSTASAAQIGDRSILAIDRVTIK